MTTRNTRTAVDIISKRYVRVFSPGPRKESAKEKKQTTVSIVIYTSRISARVSRDKSKFLKFKYANVKTCYTSLSDSRVHCTIGLGTDEG